VSAIREVAPMKIAPVGKERSKSVTFASPFGDGHAGYFAIMGHGASDGDHLVLEIARERQRAGEMPEGSIRTVKRIR
jgi:hypothetical protein